MSPANVHQGEMDLHDEDPALPVGGVKQIAEKKCLKLRLMFTSPRKDSFCIK